MRLAELEKVFNQLKPEIVRWGIVVLIFLGVMQIQGIRDARQAQQLVFMLAAISLFSLLVRNIWVTLFILWTVFLYSFFKFTGGSNYLSNIFFGAILYYLTKISFKKEHINFFVDGFLLFVCLNIFYMSIQVLGYDFIFLHMDSILNNPFRQTTASQNFIPHGLLAHQSFMGMLIAMAIPLVATRGSKLSWVVAAGLFVPLYLTKTALCFLMGSAGLLFVLYFKIPKRIWLAIFLISIVSCSFYVKKVDKFGTERFDHWFLAMKHWYAHPVTGWGLNSYANVNPLKDFRYMQGVRHFPTYVDKNGRIFRDVKSIEWWGNPHNLLITLLYEFGSVGFVFFCCYWIQRALRFMKSVKTLNTVGLAGFAFVFLGLSMGHFPILLVKMAVFIIPAIALLEVSTS